MHQAGPGQAERLARAAGPPGEADRRVEQGQRGGEQREGRVAAGHDDRGPGRSDRADGDLLERGGRRGGGSRAVDAARGLGRSRGPGRRGAGPPGRRGRQAGTPGRPRCRRGAAGPRSGRRPGRASPARRPRAPPRAAAGRWPASRATLTAVTGAVGSPGPNSCSTDMPSAWARASATRSDGSEWPDSTADTACLLTPAMPASCCCENPRVCRAIRNPAPAVPGPSIMYTDRSRQPESAPARPLRPADWVPDPACSREPIDRGYQCDNYRLGSGQHRAGEDTVGSPLIRSGRRLPAMTHRRLSFGLRPPDGRLMMR